MTEKDEEIRMIIEKLDSKNPFDHFEEIINFIEDEENHKIIRKKNLISLFLHKRYLKWEQKSFEMVEHHNIWCCILYFDIAIVQPSKLKLVWT